MFQSLQARLIFLFVAFVLLVVVSVGAMIWGSETQRQDALVINLAGRQRMLAQQMTRLALEADSRKSAVDAALLEAEAVFDRTLYALREGGAAPYPPDASVTLQKPTDPHILSALDRVAVTWGDFRTQLYKLQWASRSNPIFWLTRQAFEDQATTLVEAADGVVRLLEADAMAKINRLRAMQMGFLVGALILLGVGAWVTHRSALTPLKDLSAAADRLGGNDLESPILVTGPHEIRSLSESFDAMRKNLAASRLELLDLTTTLEARVAQRTRELNALSEVSHEISSQLDVSHVLTSVTEKARTLLDAESAKLCLLEDEDQYLTLKASAGAQAGEVVERRSAINRASAVLASQRALVCSHAGCVGGCGLLAEAHAASHVVAPLRIGDEVIGALCVSSSQPDHFSAEAADVATKLANTAAVALQNAQLFAQAEKIAALEERNRIAADMHDGLGQMLSYLGLVTDQTADLLAASEDAKALANLERMRRTINQATHQVRASIQQLMDGAPRERKLCDRLQETVREIEGKYQAKIDWQAEEGVLTAAISRPVTEQILNVTREMLENACRHAAAQSICVRFGRENGHGFVRIEDDGCGFDPAMQPAGHFGLRVMKARAEHIGGKLLIESAPGAGTCVTLLFPHGEERS